MNIWALYKSSISDTEVSNLRFVIVTSKLLKRHLKVKRRPPAYSRTLRQIRGLSKG